MIAPSPSSARGHAEIEQARLHRHVEPTVGSSMNTSRGPVDQIAGDLQPLPHAAGEGARLVVDAVVGDFDAAQPVDRVSRIWP